MIGSNFIPEIVQRTVYCSECDERIPKGAVALVSMVDGKVKKRICSEECRLDFDDAFWQAIADRREDT